MVKVIVGLLAIMLVASLIIGCYQAPASAPALPPTEKSPAPVPMPAEKAPAPADGTVHQVTIKNFAFSPKEITIKVGDTITWTNQDTAPHTATGSGFNSGNLANGQSWSYTFTAVGTFSYKCTIHPYIQGQVTVENVK